MDVLRLLSANTYTGGMNTNKNQLVRKHEQAMKVFGQSFGVQLSYQSNNTLTKGNVNLIAENCVNIRTLVGHLDSTLRGKFFLCRSLVPPFKTTAIQCLVDDPIGAEAVRLSLYNFPSDDSNLLEAIPVGTILAIKNPWLKTNNDGGCGLRVENPQNVMIVDDEMLKKLFPALVWGEDVPIQYRHLCEKKTAAEWMEVGNARFTEGKFRAAVEAYTKGLVIEPKNADILTKKASAYLCLRYFYRALEYSDKALKMDPKNLEGKHTHAKALCGLKRYSDAVRFIEKVSVESSDFVNLLANIKKLQLQHTTGEYDLMALYKGHQKHHENFADFVGALEFVKGKQSKVVATADIKAGELLMANQAFAVAYPDSTNVATSINFEKRQVNPAQHDLLVSEIAEKLKIEPEWRAAVYELNVGDKQVDTTLVDMETIRDVVSEHSFGGFINSIAGRSIEIDSPLVKEASGLWLLPSLINHSCWDANCNWLTFGDIFLLRSLKPIKKGEEILITFCDPTESLENRVEKVKTPDRRCECSLCQSDRSETTKTHKDRRRYLKQIENSNVNYDRMLRFIGQLDHLRLNNTNVYVIKPCHELAEFYFSQGKYQKAADLFVKIFEIVKDSSLMHLAVEYALKTASCYSRMNNETEERKWISIMSINVLTIYGVKNAVALVKSRLDVSYGSCRSYNLVFEFNGKNVKDHNGNLTSKQEKFES